MSFSAVVSDPVQSAKEAGLRYVTDAKPGIRRKRQGKGFRYIGPDSAPIRDHETLARIKSLVIPPAWTDVWICADPRGHLQATGRDAKGRKQSRYHPRWREVRDETKYERMVLFGAVLPAIRQQVENDLAAPGVTRRKVLATVVRLLETTFIRVGNTEYARENHSYGLTTMRNKHVEVNGSTIQFRFQGKRGIRHTINIHDRRIAKVIRRCLDLPGYELFQYVDSEGEIRSIDSADVNEYLHEISREEFTAKDFRTWAGTVLAFMALREMKEAASQTEAKKNIVQAIKNVAAQLGNTPAVCRKCYVHPAVLECYQNGKINEVCLKQAAECALREEEALLMQLLREASK
jgi:DNA topoisomerase-1